MGKKESETIKKKFKTTNADIKNNVIPDSVYNLAKQLIKDSKEEKQQISFQEKVKSFMKILMGTRYGDPGLYDHSGTKVSEKNKINLNIKDGDDNPGNLKKNDNTSKLSSKDKKLAEIIAKEHKIKDRIFYSLTERNEFCFGFAKLDCVTFIETILALAYAANKNSVDSKDNFKEDNFHQEFVKYLRVIRYKKGISNYLNRNHFTSTDAIINNKFLLDDITAYTVEKNYKISEEYKTGKDSKDSKDSKKSNLSSKSFSNKDNDSENKLIKKATAKINRFAFYIKTNKLNNYDVDKIIKLFKKSLNDSNENKDQKLFEISKLKEKIENKNSEKTKQLNNALSLVMQKYKINNKPEDVELPYISIDELFRDDKSSLDKTNSKQNEIKDINTENNNNIDGTKLTDAGNTNYDNFCARIPKDEILIVNIVRPGWDLKKFINSELNVSHQGFLIKETPKNGSKPELFIFHASTLGDKTVQKMPFKKYLEQYRGHSTIKGFNIQKVNYEGMELHLKHCYDNQEKLKKKQFKTSKDDHEKKKKGNVSTLGIL